MTDIACKDDWASRAFAPKRNGRPLSGRQIIALEAQRIADAHRQLKADFLARREARRCLPA